MCLFTTQKRANKADKDIECYKYLVEIPKSDLEFDKRHNIIEYIKLNGKRPKYMTPYQGYLIDDIPTKLKSNDKVDISYNTYILCNAVGKGMFHAFVIPNKKSLDLNLVDELYGSIKQIKCIIPKGTLYFKGLDGHICAKTLILQEII